MITTKNILSLTLCIALLLISSSYLLLTSAGDGKAAFAEPDTILYLQYAKNLATGQPYVFSDGDAPSTGSTTHLFPFILAALYKLGATGDLFALATFVLNGLFYLGIMVLIWLIAQKLYPKALWLIMLMSVLSGHLISATLRLTDIGIFTLLFLAVFACLLYKRNWLALLPVILCAVTRPEGLVFAVAFFMCGASSLLINLRKKDCAPGANKQAVFFIGYGLMGAAAFAFTLFINYRLTGHCEFMSVANKGYFKAFPLIGAIQHTMSDALSIIKGVFFGLSTGARQFYIFPFFGGFLGLAGLLLYTREKRSTRLCECWFFLSVCAAIVLIASSQFQGVSNDRYLGWVLPIWLIYIVIGVVELSERLVGKYFLPICATMLLLYQGLSLVFVATDAYTVAVEVEKERIFSEKIMVTIPPDETFGSSAGGGLSYFLPMYRIYNLWGITSPDFFEPNSNQQLERIIDRVKHRPELQFDNWLIFMNFVDRFEWVEPFIGEAVLIDTDSALATENSFGVYKAQWDSIKGGDTPILLDNQLENNVLIDSLDIGYLTDEAAHNYQYKLRLKNAKIPISSTTTTLDGKLYSEAGRIIMGSESFTVNGASPGKALRVALRTSNTADGTIYMGRQRSKIKQLKFNDQLALRVFVDGQEVPIRDLPIRNEGFSEVLIDIPGQFIARDSLTIEIVGDHVSYAYWFYQ